MTLTAQQITAINTKLGVSLSAQTDDKLIELCLLYRSAPTIRPAFTAALQTEIERRFTPAQIANNDVMFSVLQNFSNQFNPELQYKEKLYQFVNALDRELWMSENISFFEATLNVPERVTWLVADSSVFSAVLQSTLAFSKIVNSGTAMAVVVSSSTAMSAIVSNSTAMTAVANNSVALAKIIISQTARNILINNNSVFQANKQRIYTTVQNNWTKATFVSQREATANSEITSVSDAIASPAGLVFASFGYDGSSSGMASLYHSRGGIRASQPSNASGSGVNSLANLGAVSFNGAIAYCDTVYGRIYAELWTPPTT